MLVNHFLEHSARRFPDKVALICGDKRLTYSEIDSKANQVAWFLRHHGIERQDRVAIFLDNSAESVISLFGILKTDAIFVMLSPAMKAQKLSYILKNCQAKAIITHTNKLNVVSGIFGSDSSLQSVIFTGDKEKIPSANYPKPISWNAIDGHHASRPTPYGNIDLDLATIIYTSGSTGNPKGVMLTHLNMVSSATSITTYLENREDDIIIDMLPLSFDYGLYQVLMAFQFGGTVVLEKSFTYPYQVIQRMVQEGVSGFPGVPTIYAILLGLENLDEFDFSRLRYMTSTAAAFPSAHIEKLRKIFPHVRIYSMYGLTECKRVSYLPPDELDRHTASVGRGMPNEEVWIVGENGKRVGPKVVGELVVRGSNVMRGYWGLPEETTRVLKPGKYPGEVILYTGDLFQMDDEGFLYFVGRRDDMIKSRGERISPKEIEECLCALEGVAEVAVVGIPDVILGQAIKAFIRCDDGKKLTEKDVLKHCKTHLENCMIPQSIAFVDSFPKTSSGKIDKLALKGVHSTSSNDSMDSSDQIICKKCTLPSTVRSAKIDESGLCIYCRKFKGKEELERQRRQYESRFQELIDGQKASRDKFDYDILVAYSGGKDSTYILDLLKNHYNLRVLAMTFDHGFLSNYTFENIRKVVEALGINHITYKPDFEVLCKIFRFSLENEFHPPKALERASSICNSCIRLVKLVTFKTAFEKNIPFIAYGWSPGQAPLRAAIVKNHLSFVRKSQDFFLRPLQEAIGPEVLSYSLEECQCDNSGDKILPYNINPLAFLRYDEKEIYARIKDLGWQSPKDTDPNSTNCLLNAVGNQIHIEKHRHNPYAMEMAELVRQGILTAEEVLRRTSEEPDPILVEKVRTKLGIKRSERFGV